MWTREEVQDLLRVHLPIPTGGAISHHNATVSQMEDGDEWTKVELPLWSQNTYVVGGVLRLVVAAFNQHPNQCTQIYCRSNNVIILCLYTHFCDPD